jgi:hypothetical protein
MNEELRQCSECDTLHYLDGCPNCPDDKNVVPNPPIEKRLEKLDERLKLMKVILTITGYIFLLLYVVVSTITKENWLFLDITALIMFSISMYIGHVLKRNKK